MDDPAEGVRPQGAAGEPRDGAAAGVDDEVAEAVAEAVREVLSLAATLDELPLDGVEPLLGPPRWS